MNQTPFSNVLGVDDVNGSNGLVGVSPRSFGMMKSSYGWFVVLLAVVGRVVSALYAHKTLGLLHSLLDFQQHSH